MPFPLALLALFVLPGVFTANLSSNDPFRSFSALASSRPTLPVCCLKPPPPHDLVGDQVLLSFEEWKAKQWGSGEQKEHIHGVDASAGGRNTSASGDSSRAKDKIVSPEQNSTSQTSSSGSASTDDTPHQPHFRVPLTDRFNYASLDCSARVHGAHRSAKSPSNVLSSKRDRYMLSPCKPANGESQFIVVELCEDIRIDTVQLANFEFFSGVFKDFSVHVAKTDATNDKSWEDAGTFRAKNIRGVQSFHPPTSLRDFYRYIRIDFHSHYGNEYYCPVSLLRVYGLTHLEEYKLEQWEEESKGKLDIGAGSSASGDVPDQLLVNSSSMTTPTAVSTDEATATYVSMSSQHPAIQDGELEPGSVIPTGTQALLSDSRNWSSLQDSQSETSSHNPHDMNSEPSQLPTDTDISFYLDSYTTTNTLSSDSSVYSSSLSSGDHLENTPSTQHSMRISSISASASSISNSKHVTSSTLASVATPPAPVASHAAGPSSSGESIYRVIMNRLTALEANHTLYVRYVEQQSTAIRDLLKRLGEDVGRLEGIGRAHGQTHQRAVLEWERQRQQFQMELREFTVVVEYLMDEVALEKRLGIAQLCLLLLVLVFMAVTRGSRGKPPLIRYANTKSSKDQHWGRRLNLSTNWSRHLKSSSSTEGDVSIVSNQPQIPSHSSHMHTDSGSGLDDDYVFPKQKVPFTPTDMNIPSSSTNLPTHQKTDASSRKLTDHSRSRTPSFRRRPPPLHITPHAHAHFQHHGHRRTLTPSKSARGAILRRSNSHNSEVNGLWSTGIPRSARTWARSAHLHEVVRTDPLRRHKDGGENRIPSTPDLGQRNKSRHRHTSSDSRLEPASGAFASDQKRRSNRRKDFADGEDVDGGRRDSDQSAWEDTDSIPGELYDC